jgi:hypothetical protein
MIKKFILSLALISIVFSFSGCGGSGGGSSSTPRGVNPGIPSVIKLLDVQNIAQTNSNVFLKARVLDGNGLPVKNEPVTFINLSSPLGTITALNLNTSTVAYTDSFGFATAKIFSSEPGFITVQVEVGEGAGMVRARRTVFFAPFINLVPFMILEVDGDGDGIFNEPNDFILLESPGDTEFIVRATVFDRFGIPAPFTEVTFVTDIPYRVGVDGTCSDGSPDCEITFPQGNMFFTNSAGQASVLVQVNPLILRSFQTLFNVLASADNGAFNLVTMFLEPIFINMVALSADPLVVAPDGTSSITAFVTTNLLSPSPDGTAVSFTTSPTTGADPNPCGSVDPFDQTTDGVATSSFNAPPTEGTCTITGTSAGVVGGTATYQIFSGIPPYTVVSNDPAFPPVPDSGIMSGGSFDVTVPPGTPDTTVTYTIRDDAGAEVTATLNIASDALAVIPDSQTISNPTGVETADYSIIGGVGPFIAFSDNPGLATVPAGVLPGRTVTASVVGVPTEDTTVEITVFDTADGSSDSADLVLDVPPVLTLIIVPGAVTLDGTAGSTQMFTVSGGVPPYIVTSTAPFSVFNDNGAGGGTADDGIINGTEGGVWNVTLSGDMFTATVPAGTCPTTVTLNVFDSVAGSTSATVTIQLTADLSIDMSSASICEVTADCIGVGIFPTTADFDIDGGIGPYFASSSNTAVILDPAVAGDGTFTVDANNGSLTNDDNSTVDVNITVTDSCGTSLPDVVITVIDDS